MRRPFRFFFVSLLLAALAVGIGPAYRSITVAEDGSGAALLRTKSRPSHPAQLADALLIVSPAQNAPRTFVPPGELPATVPDALIAYAAPQPHNSLSAVQAEKNYLQHNYPFHAFW
ncbi:MAG: hypothetical protein EOO08_00495 [Chitinophagaceae bacterium]|nr:MAG: hypothetical protein EOO08_00495 [Chitinophagaceae bacterium]